MLRGLGWTAGDSHTSGAKLSSPHLIPRCAKSRGGQSVSDAPLAVLKKRQREARQPPPPKQPASSSSNAAPIQQQPVVKQPPPRPKQQQPRQQPATDFLDSRPLRGRDTTEDQQQPPPHFYELARDTRNIGGPQQDTDKTELPNQCTTTTTTTTPTNVCNPATADQEQHDSDMDGMPASHAGGDGHRTGSTAEADTTRQRHNPNDQPDERKDSPAAAVTYQRQHKAAS